MSLITDQTALEEFCARCKGAPYLTVDTEFMRERTYWPQLCLIQIARPATDTAEDHDPDAAVAIDPIGGDLDLSPVFDLMRDPDTVKVFHAARQDIEIFHHLGELVPAPLFDTQVAAMVCGYGDQVGYETLVRRIARATLDKSSRFTDWSRRPLTPKQIDYALGDVTHLRAVYEVLAAQLRKTGRGAWVAEEMAVLNDPATYRNDPEDAWRRLRMRGANPRVLAAAQALAAWREREAQTRDVPRGRVLKDDALLDLASSRPKTMEELTASRTLQREGRKPAVLEALLETIRAAERRDPPAAPPSAGRETQRQGAPALVELLKVLLKAKCDALGVAQKLVATTADLEAIAADPAPDSAALHGWRAGVFGDDALKLKRGEIALSADAHGVRVVSIHD
jgi:ribonuclease D